MVSTEHRQFVVDMDQSIGAGNVAILLNIKVPRSWRATLTQMFGGLIISNAADAPALSLKMAIIMSRSGIFASGSLVWADIMARGPVWIDTMGLSIVGTPADISIVSPKMKVDIDFARRSGDVQITNKLTRSNVNTGWILVAENDSSGTLNTKGGIVINMEMEWLGGHGGGPAWMFEDLRYQDQDDNNNDNTV